MIIFKDKLILHSIHTSPIISGVQYEQDMTLSLYGLQSELELKIKNFDQKFFLNFRNIFNEQKSLNKKQNHIFLDMYYGEEWNI
jgi:hypothetical protein